LLNAPKGTKLYNRMAQEDRLLKYISGNNTDLTMNFTPLMNPKDLLRGYQKVIQTIYSDKGYYDRIITFLKAYKPPKGNHAKLKFCDIEAFVRSLWHIGLARKGRRYYWKLVLWGFIRPKYLHMVVRLSISGYHFRTMFEQLQLRTVGLRTTRYRPVEKW